MIISAIAVGIRAERVYHIKEKHIRGDLNHGIKKLKFAHEQITQMRETKDKDRLCRLSFRKISVHHGCLQYHVRLGKESQLRGKMGMILDAQSRE